MKSNYGNGLYKQFEDTQNRLDAMMARLDKIEQEHREEIRELKAEHAREVAELKEEIAERDTLIQNLTERNEALEGEVSRLKSIINNDSHNSSNPPSKDQKPNRKKAVNEHNSRRKSERKQGGQEGHKGKSLTNEDVRKMLDSGHCEHKVKSIGKPSDRYVTRYIVDVKVVPVITEYRIYQNKQGRFDIPADLGTQAVYGNRLKTFVIALYGIGVVSNNRIADFIRSMTDNVIQIATGTVYGFCRSFSEKATTTLLNIEEKLMNRDVIHTDATVMTVDGVQSYIRNVSTEDAVMYYDLPHKTVEEMKKVNVLTKHVGVMVHDHETALYRFPAQHAECNVHILRYLAKNSEDTKNDWSKQMSSFLLKANIDRKVLIEQELTSFSDDDIAEMEAEYDRILALGMEQNKGTKLLWAKKDEKKLLNRLRKYKPNHLLFLHRFDVSFDNNLSERDLRKCKNRQKMSGGFRTQVGCSMFCDILSVIETAKRQNVSPFEAIGKVLAGEALFEIPIRGGEQ